MLAVVYLVYNEGYLASGGDAVDRDELRAEAVRLARQLVTLMPDEPEAVGLLALLLLTESRAAARRTPSGAWVLLEDQDRSRWDAALIAEGQSLVRACLRRNHPGPYQVQAAIAAVHSDAATASDTDWAQIVALYDQLLALQPTPVVAMNRAIAVAEVDGPAAALALVDDLELQGYHLWHATRGDLLERLGETDAARDAFARAASLTDNPAERDLLLHADRHGHAAGRVVLALWRGEVRKSSGVPSAHHASSSSADQVLMTRSAGTPHSAARAHPYACQSSWPGAWASVSMEK